MTEQVKKQNPSEEGLDLYGFIIVYLFRVVVIKKNNSVRLKSGKQ